MTRKLAITIGDPAGVGPELIALMLQQGPDWIERVQIFGNASTLASMALPSGTMCFETPTDGKVEAGCPSTVSGKIAVEAMQMAAQSCLDGKSSGVVTGPISKQYCRMAGMSQPGQTEFFADAWGGEPTMAFYSRQMIVSLVTWHIPLSEVPAAVTESALERAIGHTHEFLIQLGVHDPKMAVCGLNPHAGEAGQMGTEERDLINPLISRLATNGIPVAGAFPADTLFYRMGKGDFSAVIALYHDQGLAPLKTVAFHDAVNVSLGLKYIRTSPDHGTAFDIAGKGLAKPDSLIEATRLALRLCSVG
jgi:4-hydroxythreonine-4-phosphate dehydrogenase